MYKCTECNAIFEQCPDFCDCGNDIFEEIIENNSVLNTIETEEIAIQIPQKKKRKLSQAEIQEIKEEKEDKKKAFITICISLIICFAVLISPPYLEKKNTHKKTKAQCVEIKIPSVNSFWDDSIPAEHKKLSTEDNLPLLNNSFGNISMELHNYLVRIGEEFDQNWTKSIIKGEGECKIQFTINKDGIIDNKKLLYKSNNETMNDSILLTLSKMTNLEVPPEDYKGERIILAFKSTQNANKVYYPTK